MEGQGQGWHYCIHVADNTRRKHDKDTKSSLLPLFMPNYKQEEAACLGVGFKACVERITSGMPLGSHMRSPVLSLMPSIGQRRATLLPDQNFSQE